MNVFELIFVMLSIIGAVLGVRHHGVLHVGPIIGGLIGTTGGDLTAVAFTFVCAVVLSLITGEPLFRPEKGNLDGTRLAMGDA